MRKICKCTQAHAYNFHEFWLKTNLIIFRFEQDCYDQENNTTVLKKYTLKYNSISVFLFQEYGMSLGSYDLIVFHSYFDCTTM